VYGRSLEALMVSLYSEATLGDRAVAGCSISGTVDILRGEVEMVLDLS